MTDENLMSHVVNVHFICNSKATAYNLDNSTKILTMTNYLKVVSNPWNFGMLISAAFFLGSFITTLIFLFKSNLTRRFRTRNYRKNSQLELSRYITNRDEKRTRNIVREKLETVSDEEMLKNLRSI